MYSTLNNVIFGFHGCDEKIRDNLVSGIEKMHISKNPYDWLGNGMYFWENDPQRALQWAEQTKEHSQNGKQNISKPSVVGAAICLGKCLDLLSVENLEKLREYYRVLEKTQNLPQNSEDNLRRNLDCFVINSFVSFQKKCGTVYDSVRGVFFEGSELYPTSGFREKNHIQIAVINPNCIKGFFIPRDIEEVQ